MTIERPSPLAIKVSWRCRVGDRITTHHVTDKFANPGSVALALEMIRRDPPPCPHGCTPAPEELR